MEQGGIERERSEEEEEKGKEGGGRKRSRRKYISVRNFSYYSCQNILGQMYYYEHVSTRWVWLVSTLYMYLLGGCGSLARCTCIC